MSKISDPSDSIFKKSYNLFSNLVQSYVNDNFVSKINLVIDIFSFGRSVYNLYQNTVEINRINDTNIVQKNKYNVYEKELIIMNKKIEVLKDKLVSFDYKSKLVAENLKILGEEFEILCNEFEYIIVFYYMFYFLLLFILICCLIYLISFENKKKNCKPIY